jgi:hypothetical protein
MIRYVTLGADDLVRAGFFYDAALEPLGYIRQITTEVELGYGPPVRAGIRPKPLLWVLKPYDGRPATFGNGVDVAFEASSSAAVDAFHAAALAAGGTDEGGPGIRAHYSPTFYTAYVRDPVGNKLNAVYNSAE